MAINIKKARIARMLFVLSISLIYVWLVIWTTRKITQYKVEDTFLKKHDDNLIGNINEKVLERNYGRNKLIPPINQTIKHCHEELPVSTQRWLRARLEPKIKPQWTKENQELKFQVYEWWLNLQHSQGINTIKALDELFDTGVPITNPNNERINTTKCIKCAVVGNSGNLRESHYGKMIDQHDFVIRMNKAPTNNFENHVGSKTTHRFMYPESSLTSLTKDVSYVLTPFKPMDLKWLLSALTTGEIQHTYAPVPRKIDCDKSKIIIINPYFIWYVQNRWTQEHGRYPSTGFLAVIYALHECDDINLFGFGANAHGAWHHYWEDLPENMAGAFKTTGVHDPEWEKTILEQLETHGIVQIYRNTK